LENQYVSKAFSQVDGTGGAAAGDEEQVRSWQVRTDGVLEVTNQRVASVRFWC
jgi:hypothetical protein